ncbi:hypothetical protein [Desulfatibacillum aliphaticivorans]|nr:hypothetical protein [Desulfatibacillum aliphaticivorans]
MPKATLMIMSAHLREDRAEVNLASARGCDYFPILKDRKAS